MLNLDVFSFRTAPQTGSLGIIWLLTHARIARQVAQNLFNQLSSSARLLTVQGFFYCQKLHQISSQRVCPTTFEVKVSIIID